MRKATFGVAALLVAFGVVASGAFACDFVWP